MTSAPEDTSPPWDEEGSTPVSAPSATQAQPTREALAKSVRLSNITLSLIEKIQKTAAPELVAAVKSGSISISTAATVASLPEIEQVAAAAGSKKELRQATRPVRAAKAVERTDPQTPEGVIARLKQTIAELTSENIAIKVRLASAGV